MENIKNTQKNQTLIGEKAAAAMLSISYEVLRKRLRPQRQIPYLRIGNSIRYSVKDLNSYLAKCRIEAKN